MEKNLMDKELIRLNKISKVYQSGEYPLRALDKIDLVIKKGEFVTLMGVSGSGKSTLMNLLGFLDNPTEGDYYLEGINMKDLTMDQRSDIRNQKIGFVFQSFHLLSRTSALENVELPLLYDRRKRNNNTRELALKALQRVGLEQRIEYIPSRLSGGQQQRVAIARAIINHPAILLADEPTGNLDSKTSYAIMNLFQALNDEGITIILVTHEADIAQYAKRNIVLSDGHIIKDFIVTKRLEAEKA